MTDYGIAIIGSGFSGMGMAIHLLEEGRDDFVILERADDVGGTWQANRYPGCQCDIPSHLYSFSFAPNPDWTRTYSKQPEIRAYMRRVAEEHGVMPYVRFNSEVTGADWDEEAAHWRLQTSQGELTAQVVVAGVGGLSEPSIPSIPGLESFRGAAFHTAAWDDDHDVTGERVAVIGTGASAVQTVPSIQPDVVEPQGVHAHAAVGRPAQRPADHRRRAAPLPPRARPPRRRCARWSTGCTRRWSSAS